MSSLTPYYNLILPAINDPTDQDLWGGMLNSNFEKIDTIIHDIAIKEPYPVGSLYFNADVATNPATLLGYGTWVAHGAGRVLVGVGSTTDSRGESRTFTNGTAGGAYQHQLTVPELARHRHSMNPPPLSNQGGPIGPWASGGVVTAINFTNYEGNDVPHNNVQPYVTVYIWRRTA